jgi:hypothetical protein
MHRVHRRIRKRLRIKPRRLFSLAIVPKTNGVFCLRHNFTPCVFDYTFCRLSRAHKEISRILGKH